MLKKTSFAGAFLVLGAFAGTDVALAYEVVDVANGGTISGKVLLKGKAIAAKSFKVEKTPEVCGKEDRVLEEVRIDGGGLADVVVFLEGVKKGKPYAAEVSIDGPPPGKRTQKGSNGKEFPGTTIRPKNCIFGAFTGVVAQGKLFRFKNQDPVKHSPHTYAVKGKVRKSMFNLDLEGDSTLDVPVKFKKKKIKVVKLECDQHNHMQNWFYRVDSPYYAFSGKGGSFKINGIPPGKYKLIAWHPKFKKILKQKVTIKAGGKLGADFTFKSKVK